MQKIEKVLKGSIKRNKLEDKLKLVKAARSWEKIVSDFFPDAAGKTMVVSLKDGVLIIASLSRDLAHSIMMFQKRILYELNRLIGKTLLFAIRCQC